MMAMDDEEFDQVKAFALRAFSPLEVGVHGNTGKTTPKRLSLPLQNCAGERTAAGGPSRGALAAAKTACRSRGRIVTLFRTGIQSLMVRSAGRRPPHASRVCLPTHTLFHSRICSHTRPGERTPLACPRGGSREETGVNGCDVAPFRTEHQSLMVRSAGPRPDRYTGRQSRVCRHSLLTVSLHPELCL